MKKADLYFIIGLCIFGLLTNLHSNIFDNTYSKGGAAYEYMAEVFENQDKACISDSNGKGVATMFFEENMELYQLGKIEEIYDYIEKNNLDVGLCETQTR